MKTISGYLCTAFIFCSILFLGNQHACAEVTIIKNGGGSELIENTLVASSIAVAKGADYLELPVNLSGDGHLVVYKDTTLNRLTDVAELFPLRQREDGNFYVVDFNLNELRQLRLRNVFEEGIHSLSLGIPTLEEELTLIGKLNSLLQKDTGVVIDLQEPAFYNKEGKDLSSRLQHTLDTLSYTPEDKLFIQSADPDELQKIARWPQDVNGERFRLIQLITLKENISSEQTDQLPIHYQHNWLFTNSGLRILASYATAVSLPPETLTTNGPESDQFIQSLRKYDIKIFMQKDSNYTQTTSLIQQADYDGVYLNQIRSLQVAKQPQEPTLVEPPPNNQAVRKQTTLPPFFSNLGLSQPNNTNNTARSENTDLSQEKSAQP